MGLKALFKHSIWITWKDLLDLGRNRIALVMLILMPMFMMIMTGYIFPSQNALNDVPVAYVNLDEGADSQIFMDQLRNITEHSGMISLKKTENIDTAREMIKNGDANGGIIISANFTVALRSGEQGQIILLNDQSNPQISSMLTAILENVIRNSLGAIRAAMNVAMLDNGNQTQNQTMTNSTGSATNSTLPITNMTANQTDLSGNPMAIYEEYKAVIQPYSIETKGVVEGEMTYFDFMAPGIMAMVVMMSVMTGLPHAISYEKDIGTLDGFLVAPINRMSIILGKVLAQTTRGIVQGILILILAILIFNVHIHGSIPLIFLLLFLGVFSFIGLGILLTSIANDEETAGMIMMAIMFPMMFLSGVFFPVQQMPEFIQTISKFLPLTYAANALRKVMVLGAGLENIAVEIMILVAFGTVLLFVAVPAFKRAMTR